MSTLDIKAAIDIAAEERRLATEPRPIESAPKDGTVILGHDRNGWREMWWNEDMYEGDCWRDHADSEPNPTHWLPLPPRPNN